MRTVVRDLAQSEEVTQEVYLQSWAQSETNRNMTYGLRQRPIAFDSTAEEAHRRLDGERVRRAMDRLTVTLRDTLGVQR